MGWLRKAQSIPAFPIRNEPTDGTIQGRAFYDFIGQNAEALYPEPDFAHNADYGFDKNELVYACIMEKATSLPDAPFRVFGADGQGESREDHPLRRLISNPNPASTEFEMMELTSIYMDLAGIAFWEIVKDRLDRPVELWPLRPDRVRIFPQRNGRTEYGYTIGGGRVVPLGTDVLTFKYPNPLNPPLGQAPMRAANRAVALDNEATDFVKALLQNRAVPGTVIEVEQKIDADLTDRLTAKWIERFGNNNRGKPAFLQKGMKVHTLGLNLGELEFPDLRTISESRICMSFGVPPILVGAKVGLDRSTFANYREARVSLWEETLMPLQKRMQQVIVKTLMPMVEGPRPRRSVARFDNSEVLALRESEGKRWELATQAFARGGITRNQFCRYVGLPTVPGGDVYMLPAGVIPTDVAGNPVIESITVTPRPAPADDTVAPGDNDGSEQSGALLDLEAKQVSTAAVLAFKASVAKVVRRQQSEVLGGVAKYRALLIDRPNRFGSILPNAHVLANPAALAAKADLWDVEKWDRELAAAMEPHMRQAALRAARRVDKDEPTDPMDGYIRAAARNTAARWNTATRDAVDAALVTGGEDVEANVGAVFLLAAGTRALTLARSLSTEMNGFGAVDTAKRVGLSYKTWVVTSANPREEHAALDGETVPVGQPFSNGQQWPGGPNCQCDVTFEEGT